MKEHLNAALRSFVCALACAALGALAIALMLALYDFDRTVHLHIGTWVLVLAVQAVLNEIMVARGATQLIFLIINGILLFFGSGALVVRTVFVPGSGGFPVLLRILFFLSGFAGAYAAQKNPGSNVFVRLQDALVLSAAAYLGAAFALGDAMHVSILSFALVTLLLSMLLTAALRAGGESDSVIRGTGVGGWLVLLALLALCLLLTMGILSVSGGHIDSLVDILKLLWQLLCRIGTFCLHALAWFLSLFVGKYRHVRVDPVYETPDTPNLEGMAPVDAPGWIVYIFFAALAAALIALIVAVIRMLHGAKLTRSRTARRRRRVTRRNHFLSALRALIAAAAGRIAFETAYRFGPPSPQRLYVLAVRTGLLHRLGKKRAETPGAYLRRYHLALTAQHAESSLDLLADMLDAALYGGAKPTLSREEYGRIAGQIRSLRIPEKQAPLS